MAEIEKNEKSDAQELSEVLEVLGSKGPSGIGAVLDVVAEKVPALINALRSTLYSPQAGEEMGKGVGAFYRELVAAGLPEKEALAMTHSYLSSLKQVLRSSMQQNQTGEHGGDEG
jgi:hypothetical protein